MTWSQAWMRSQSTYICRVQSWVSRIPKYWPPHPLSTQRVCTPPRQRRGQHTRQAVRGWGSIFWKTRDIGLASYSIIILRMRCDLLHMRCTVHVQYSHIWERFSLVWMKFSLLWILCSLLSSECSLAGIRCSKRGYHKVFIEQSTTVRMFLRRILDSPNPSPASECALPLTKGWG